MYIVAEKEGQLYFAPGMSVSVPDCDFSEYISEKLRTLEGKNSSENALECCSINFSIGIPEYIITALPSEQRAALELKKEDNEYVETTQTAITQDVNTDTSEEYAISFGTRTDVYASTPAGFLRALSTLMIFTDKNALKVQTVYDRPDCAVRGYRVYMPGRKTLSDFIDMLDILVYYKYNSLILEIGGAMEYEKHPLINEKWIEFCEDMGEYSGKADVVQNSQHWAKNSIHYENGDGSFLTKNECRLIVNECKKRGIEIIPECPTLSHADYICLAYPHLAERNNDPYPDTYCPSNPESYKIVFDIIDEVIEVFDPKKINIGHDEFYTVGICERCQGKNNAAIYAEDVRKIKEYLDSKGIATYMWGEKLLKARYPNGRRIGGWYEEGNYNGVRFRIPSMFQCADLLPKGVTYLHWYWEFGEHLDDEYHAREYPVVFGNFSGLRCQNYRTRIKRGVKGGFVSNWGSNAVEYMQRNGQFFNLASTSHVLWSSTYDTKDASELKKTIYPELYAKYCAGVKNPLKVRHSAYYSIAPQAFWCGRFIEDSVYVLGDYRITYTDGTEAYLPVKLGTNIASHTPTDREITESGYMTLAIKQEEGYTFEHTYEDPHPEKEIASVMYQPRDGKENIRVDYEFIGI